MCLSISFSKIHPSKWIVVSHHWTRIRDYFSPFLAHVLVFCISNEGKDDKDSFEVVSVRKQKEIHIKLINDKDSSNETQRNDDSKFTRAQALMLWCDKRFLHNFSPTYIWTTLCWKSCFAWLLVKLQITIKLSKKMNGSINHIAPFNPIACDKVFFYGKETQMILVRWMNWWFCPPRPHNPCQILCFFTPRVYHLLNEGKPHFYM